MGVAVPQVITTDRASNNQFIDGSLKFDKVKNYLKRTPSSSGKPKNLDLEWLGKKMHVGCPLMSRVFWPTTDQLMEILD